jgi:hypothetical protein
MSYIVYKITDETHSTFIKSEQLKELGTGKIINGWTRFIIKTLIEKDIECSLFIFTGNKCENYANSHNDGIDFTLQELWGAMNTNCPENIQIKCQHLRKFYNIV